MHKIRIIGFFFENRLHWQYAMEKVSTNGCCSTVHVIVSGTNRQPAFTNIYRIKEVTS